MSDAATFKGQDVDESKTNSSTCFGITYTILMAATARSLGTVQK